MNYQDLHEGQNIRFEDIVWIKNGKAHREDGPAIEHKLGYTAWYFEGQKHRLGGPAIIWESGDEEWFVHGLRHCEDGPAYIEANGTKEWWINGIELTEEQFNQWLAKKKLNEELQSTLQEKPSVKKHKI